MADVNYVNPSSIRPEYDYKPNGILGGMMFARDRERYDQMAGLQDLMMQAQASKSQEDLIQGAPVRQAEREATLRDLPMKSRGLAAQTEGQELSTAFTRATQPGTIGATNAESATKMSNQGLIQTQNRLALTEALSRVGGPSAVSQIAQILRQSGMDMQDPFVQALLNVPDPSQVAGRARQAREALSASYSQAMDLERLQQDGANRRVERQGHWALEAARARAAAQKKDMVTQFLRGDDNHKLTIGAALISNPDLDEVTKMMVENAMAQARQNLAAKAQTNNPFNIPGIQSSVPQPGNWQPGSPVTNPNANDPLGLRR